MKIKLLNLRQQPRLYYINSLIEVITVIKELNLQNCGFSIPKLRQKPSDSNKPRLSCKISIIIVDHNHHRNLQN